VQNVFFFNIFYNLGNFVGLLRELEEEVETREYLVEEKLSKEVAALSREIELLTQVSREPHDVPPRHDAHARLSRELASLTSTHQSALAIHSKLAPFTNQAQLIAKRKDHLAQTYNENKLELDSLLAQIQVPDPFT
jgi:hypothetical protein